MIQKAINILRVRWPEVMLVVGLHVAMALLVEDVVAATEGMDASSAAPPFWASFLLGMGMILCGILWQMIYLGFLKTAAVSEGEPKQPMQLLRTGRPYFWRILLFQMMLGFAVMLLNAVFLNVLGGLIWQGRSIEQLPVWFAQVCALGGMLIVLKPMLLVPACVIVYDISAFVAFGQMRFYRLGQIGGIFKAIIIGFGIIALSVLPSVLLGIEGPWRYISSGLYSAAISLVLLALAMMAVLWVQQQFEVEMAEASEEESCV
ncbi:MAG: hypothetical protein B6I25_04590 [Planctomycetales bacterium 4572_13]|nr:MAG: hypothetical protein B6I25_04590 [Planctomycetales bacterium 4572_13]